jgi:hypothetical protein
MTSEEMAELAWSPMAGEPNPTVILLSGNNRLFVSSDEEGNGPGVWVVGSKSGEELL